MYKILPIICLISLAFATACKDKNPKTIDNQDLPGQVVQPGSIDPQSVAGRLDQATSAAAGMAWAGDVDLICGMKVDQTAEDTVHYAGKIYGFCSESCKESFQEDPKKWANQQ